MTKTKKATKNRIRRAAPARSMIRKRLNELRTLIDTTEDPCLIRIAYAMETAIRWATEHTVGWQTPAKEARQLAEMLRTEIGVRK